MKWTQETAGGPAGQNNNGIGIRTGKQKKKQFTVSESLHIHENQNGETGVGKE